MAGILVQAGAVQWVFHDAFTVGRPEHHADVALMDNYVSNRHARFLPEDGEWFVEDLGSTNGTWLRASALNGGLRLRGRVRITQGDKVIVGRTTLILVPL